MSPLTPGALIAGLRTPSLRPWDNVRQPAADPVPGELRARFLGVSTILLADGTTTILTDGFFTRPGLLRTRFGRVRPNPRRIEETLRRFNIDYLDAVIVLHSHYDHALDAPLVADRTGAILFGSPSTHNIARGHDFPDSRFVTLEQAEPFTIGKFHLTALPSIHSPGDLAPGTIDTPIDAKRATAHSYKTGDCYTLHITHPSGRLLIQASANFIPGALDGYAADSVYLGIGTLGKQPDTFKDDYWHAVVAATGARTVIPIHWDNFTTPIDKPLRPLPAFFDDVPASLTYLSHRAQAQDLELALPVLGRLVDPFAARR